MILNSSNAWIGTYCDLRLNTWMMLKGHIKLACVQRSVFGPFKVMYRNTNKQKPVRFKQWEKCLKKKLRACEYDTEVVCCMLCGIKKFSYQKVEEILKKIVEERRANKQTLITLSVVRAAKDLRFLSIKNSLNISSCRFFFLK